MTCLIAARCGPLSLVVIIVEALQHHLLLVERDHPVGAGRDRAEPAVIGLVLERGQDFRVEDIEAVGEGLELGGEGRFADADLVRPELLDLLDPVVEILEAQLHIRVADIIDRRDHVVGTEIVAVVEFHIVAQIELEGAVVDLPPGFGEARHEFMRTLVIAHERFVDDAEEHRRLVEGN